MLNEPSIDLSIGFDDINDKPKYIHIPFWITWALDPMETFESIKGKIENGTYQQVNLITIANFVHSFAVTEIKGVR